MFSSSARYGKQRAQLILPEHFLIKKLSCLSSAPSRQKVAKRLESDVEKLLGLLFARVKMHWDAALSRASTYDPNILRSTQQLPDMQRKVSQIFINGITCFFLRNETSFYGLLDVILFTVYRITNLFLHYLYICLRSKIILYFSYFLQNELCDQMKYMSNP